METAFLEGLDKQISIARYSAYHMEPIPCDDCRDCLRHDRCKYSDLDGFFAAFQEADIFLIVTPVYNMSLPAPAKAVTDRFQRYYNAWKAGRNPPKPKRTVLLTASGSGETDGALHIAKMFRRLFTVMNTGLAACFDMFETDTVPVDLAVLEDIRRFAETL